jgi:AcrR family transcriptional regulator
MSTLGQIKQTDRGTKIPLVRAQGPRVDNNHVDVRQDGRDLRVEREAKEKDTRNLIVEVAERLFRQIGFQKTTVVDIARELQMSPANVYRFFTAKSEINEAVCMDLLSKIEAEAEKIAASRGTGAQKIRNLFGSVEKAHHKLFIAAITRV